MMMFPESLIAQVGCFDGRVEGLHTSFPEPPSTWSWNEGSVWNKSSTAGMLLPRVLSSVTRCGIIDDSGQEHKLGDLPFPT